MATTPDPLKHINRKLARAKKQLGELDRTAKTFFEQQFYSALLYHEKKTPWWLLIIEEVAPTPPEVGIIAGEVAHHLRSSLDHLMWLLARPKSRHEERAVEFPIAFTRKEFVGRVGGQPGVSALKGMRYKMPWVKRGVWATVESLQPYNSRKCLGAETLGFLREINNWDKHRSLTIVGASISAVDPNVRVVEGGAEIVIVETFTGMLKPNTELARIKFTDASAKFKMEVKPQLSVEPFLDDTMPPRIAGRNLLTTLHETGRFIQQKVLPALKPFL